MTLFPTRSALILLATTALVSASSSALAQMPRPNFPIRQEQVASETVSTATRESAPRREEPPMPAVPEPEGVQSRPLEQVAARREPPPVATEAYAQPVASRSRSTRAGSRVVEAEAPARTYKVRKGDNLAAIAKKLGVDQDALAKANGLRSPYRLRAGQELKTPGVEPAAKGETRSKTKAKVAPKDYVVQKGDTLYAIARRFDTTPKAIADANKMSVRTGLSAGRHLILPGDIKEAGRAAIDDAVADVEPPAPKGKRGRVKPAEAEPYNPPPERSASGGLVRTSVTGKVIEVEGGPTSHKVRKGDTVDEIADDMGISRSELAKINKLKAPYPLKLGQVLKGPPKRVKAYVPVEGDTLASIGKRFNVSAKALASANRMKSGASVRSGKRLILPAGFRYKGPLKETIRSAPSTPAYSPPPYNPPPERPTPTPVTPVTPRPYTPPAYTPAAPTPNRPAAPTPTTGPLSDSQISILGRGRFQWPIRGDIMSEFGPKGTGQRNDGINIRAQAGDPVRAAAAGDVVYAGDQVPGFGNLVLVKHADGWVTAYGHLGRVDVKMQQKIVQGQQLGTAGQSGGVSEPQLHFEVRYAPSPTERARPVDPQLVLAR